MNFHRLISLTQNAQDLMPGAQETLGTLNTAILTRVLSSACLAASYLLLYPAFQHLFAGTLNPGFIALLTGLMLVLYLVQYKLQTYSSRQFYDIAYTVCDVLRLRMAAHLSKIPLGTLQKDKVTKVKSIITDDLQLVANYSGTLAGFFVTALTIVTLLLTGLLFINWKLSLTLLSTLLVALPGLYVMNRFIVKYGQKHFETLSELSLSILEYVGGINVLKSYGVAGRSFSRLDKALEETKQTILYLEIGSALLFVLTLLVVEISFPLILGVGTYLWLNGSLDPATLMFGLVLSVRLYSPVKEAMALASEFKYLEKAIDRIDTVFEMKPQASVTNGPPLEKHDIAFENAGFSYEGDQEHHAFSLKDLTFKCPENTVTALVGPSGSGKTTITNLIARFWDVQSGAVKIGGIDVRDLPMDTLLSHISFVFQDVVLFNDTVAANLRIANPHASDEDMIEAAKHAHCHDFIMALPQGYDTLIGEGGGRLSGGEKQRLSIARAILKDAPILLLDEATASVDPSSEQHIQNALKYLMQGKTVVMIAHKLSTVVNADQILVMKDGYIAERGDHQSLLNRKGIYHTLWDKQSRAAHWQIQNSAPSQQHRNTASIATGVAHVK